MDSRIPYTFLICLGLLHVALAKVPSPTNVTLYCHNMQNTLQWSYDEPTPGLRFKVMVRLTSVDPVKLWVDPPAQSIDLSNFSDPEKDYYVTLSAVNGSDESIEVPEDGIIYSYFKDSPAAQKCNVDLPSVNVTALEDRLLHFSFKHPGLLYNTKPKPRKGKRDNSQIKLPPFDYHIEIINQTEPYNRNCKDKICEGKLPVDGNQEIYCLKITGEMNKMAVQAPRTYCSKPLIPEKNSILAYALPIGLVTVGLVIVSMVCIKRTRPSTEMSTSLNFTNKNGPSLPGTTNENISEVLLVEPHSPTPLIPPDQDKTTFSEVATSESNGWIRVTQSSAQDEAEQVIEGSKGEGGGYQPGTCLEDGEEEIHTAYEKRNQP